MAPTLEFNNGASNKIILIDRHKSKGHKIISRLTIIICANTLYKIAPFRKMHNNFENDHQLKFRFRTPVSPWPVQCTQLHFSPPLRSFNRHQPAFFTSHSSKREANEKKCAAFWVFVRMPPVCVPSNGDVELQTNLKAITIILGKRGKG
jgi:hypothetical protein